MQQTIQTVGRRKTSTARILLRNGKGSITINNKSFENFFPQPVLQNALGSTT